MKRGRTKTELSPLENSALMPILPTETPDLLTYYHEKSRKLQPLKIRSRYRQAGG